MQDPVAFTVGLEDPYSPAVGERIPYNIVITNVGSGYVVQRNEFVCPQAGTYVFYSSLLATSNTWCWSELYRNEEILGCIFSSHEVDAMGSNMFVLELTEADTVSIRGAQQPGCSLQGVNNHNTFSGFKVG